jgi:hypothetical protein
MAEGALSSNADIQKLIQAIDPAEVTRLAEQALRSAPDTQKFLESVDFGSIYGLLRSASNPTVFEERLSESLQLVTVSATISWNIAAPEAPRRQLDAKVVVAFVFVVTLARLYQFYLDDPALAHTVLDITGLISLAAWVSNLTSKYIAEWFKQSDTDRKDSGG